MPEKRQPTMEPLEEEVDHVRGPVGRSCPRRVRRLRMPLLAAGVSRDRTGRTTTQRWRSLRLPALPARQTSTRTHWRRRPPPRQPRSKTASGRCTSCSFIARRRSKTTTCGAMPPSSTSTSSSSTKTGPTRASRGGSVGTSRADWHRARCEAHRPCSSTASCTAAATTQRPCWKHWPDECDLLAHRQHHADGVAGRDRRLHGLPRDRRNLAAPAHVPVLRPHRLLRQLAEPPRLRPRPQLRTPDRPLRRARGRLELVLPRQRRVRRHER